MEQFYFSVPLSDGRELCLAPLTSRRILMSEDKVSDIVGYFLFEKNGAGEGAEVSIIAQAVSEEAALRLREMLNMS